MPYPIAATMARGSKGQNAASTLLDGLLLALPLDESSGNRLDRSGRGNDFAAAGTVKPGLGVCGTGLQCFYSGSDHLILTDANAGDFEFGDTAWTLACWVTLESKNPGGVISKWYAGGGATERSWMLLYQPPATDRFRFLMSANGVASTVLNMDSLGAPALRTKYCIIIWYDPVTNLMYAQANNGAIDSADHAGGAYNSTADVYIGRYDTSYFDGVIDEVHIWNRILTLDERAEFYNAGMGVSYPFPGVAASVVDVMGGRLPLNNNYVLSRLSHQRQCFYAAGLYWLFYTFQSFSPPAAPWRLYFATSADGYRWSTNTNLTTVPSADAHWQLCYDAANNKVHVIKAIQEAPIYHDGALYRRGTPNVDGTITWDADWQTAIALGTRAGDMNLAVGTDGHAWIGYSDASELPTITKNGNTDGTWSTEAGFPVVLFGTPQRGCIVSPLAAGGVHATVYRYNGDGVALGYYSSDGSLPFTDEGAITVSSVQGIDGVTPMVGSIEAESSSGVVHLAYQTDDQRIVYRRRNADGTFEDEIELSDNSRVAAAISSPRVSFGAAGQIYVIWSTDANIYLCTYSGAAWGTPTAVVTEALQDWFEHAMPAELANGTKLQLVYLTDDYRLRHRLLSV